MKAFTLATVLTVMLLLVALDVATSRYPHLLLPSVRLVALGLVLGSGLCVVVLIAEAAGDLADRWIAFTDWWASLWAPRTGRRL